MSGAQRAPGPTLVRGKRHFAHSPIQFEFGEFSGKDDELDSSPFTDHRDEHRNHSRMPKTDFPQFDGDNPKWWKAVAEKYFSMYHVPRDTWAHFATMHFIGNAALWLQTYEVEYEVDNWEELVVVVHDKFGKDKHHRYLQALERCRQTDSIESYFHKFEALRHKVLVHNRHYDEAFFVTKFVTGLKHDIQKAIRLHHPRTVDAALSLAERRRRCWKKLVSTLHPSTSMTTSLLISPRHTTEASSSLLAMRRKDMMLNQPGLRRCQLCAPSDELVVNVSSAGTSTNQATNVLLQCL